MRLSALDWLGAGIVLPGMSIIVLGWHTKGLAYDFFRFLSRPQDERTPAGTATHQHMAHRSGTARELEVPTSNPAAKTDSLGPIWSLP